MLRSKIGEKGDLRVPRLLSVTVGISSFNEERNIGKLLDELLPQEEDENFSIAQIIISDDSQDSTCRIIEQYAKRDKRIQLYHHSIRRGKPSAINEIFSRAEGDIVVLLDADILPADRMLMRRLIHPFLKQPKLGIAAGAAVALKPRTIQERMAYFTFKIWRHLREELRGGNSFFSVHGKVMAVSSIISRNVVIPDGVIGDDGYLYLICKRLGLDVYYHRDAVVYYRETSNMGDFLKRRIKYEKNLNQLIGFIGEFARREIFIPRTLLLRTCLTEGIRDPIGLILSVPAVIFSKIYSRKFYMDPIWPIAVSTKKL